MIYWYIDIILESYVQWQQRNISMEDKEIDDVQTDKKEIHREDEELLKSNIVEKSVVTSKNNISGISWRCTG